MSNLLKPIPAKIARRSTMQSGIGVSTMTIWQYETSQIKQRAKEIHDVLVAYSDCLLEFRMRIEAINDSSDEDVFDGNAKSCRTCLDKQNEFKLSYKEQCYSMYGGYKCVCCGESEPIFLTLDHIDNDGGKERKMVGSRSNRYEWILKNKPNLQVMCYNCNCGRARNNGICPHATVARTVAGES